MKRTFLILFLSVFLGSCPALAELDAALVRQQTTADCGPAALYDALLLSDVREAVLASFSYENFLGVYGKNRFQEGVGTELDDVALMGKEALQSLNFHGFSLQFLDVKPLDLDGIYRNFEESFDQGFDPVIGIGFRTRQGERQNGHALMIYKVQQEQDSLILSYLDPQDLSLGELTVSRTREVRSNTLYSDRSTPLWTLDGMIRSR
jgi:hypothetical protein